MSDLLTALRTVGAYYGDHDTETIDFDTEDSLELDDSLSPDQAVQVLASFAGDATLKSTGRMRAVETLDRPEAEPPPVVPPKVEPASALPPPRATQPSKTKSGPMLGLAIGGLVGAGLLFWALTSSPTPAPELGTPVAPESTPELPPELPPEPTPEATPEPTPEATPEPTPRPVAKPAPVPRPTPAPIVKPKPTPKPESTPDTTVPGYKDNPYGD
jgi:outer membrane biosynthesis protein TonB